MTVDNPVRYDREGEIAVIEIDNPPVNALSAACLKYTSPSPRD